MSSPIDDKDFDLISTLYHATQGAHRSDGYARDAESRSDSEVQEFFKKASQQYSNLADEARQLIKQRL
ncbi:hypothetical protein [Billgrantia endophytica]|uniref:Uncharacterized protein n=1 Tax=Billgrantia endophytica TaxID=2033802 RepID=A0A2N7U427_9GAMM|nr:hypothetical protein [Halomonas endophytica]PMR75195.1 hypothetical protein C1H69_10980 [Halomonas endophytica]